MTVKTNTEYEIVIGLEIHAELLTKSKAFCECSTAFGGEPNTQVCPVCLGLPGAMPVLNEEAVRLAVLSGLALNCDIASVSRFDRKHYFYPDSPKAYQTTQNDEPICLNGYVEFDVDDGPRRVSLERIHMEEEAGRSVHEGDSVLDSKYSLIDYNRCGIPLIEIVTKPDIRSPEEARLFLEQLKAILEYAGVSDVKMEEGSLRCDANLSLRPKGSTEYGAKTEVKNMNSFRAVQRALEYEAQRQQKLLEQGETVIEETRHWDEGRGATRSMRAEEADYRFMPEPDLPPMETDEAFIESVRELLPELPRAKQLRFMEQYDLPRYDAEVLTLTQPLADFYEACVGAFNKPKTVSNWVMGEFLRMLREDDLEVTDVDFAPSALAELLQLVDDGKISGNVGKEVFEEMFRTGKSAAAIVEERGLEQISDTDALAAMVDEVIVEHADAADNVRAGEMRAIGFLVGQVMAKTKGQANPQLVNELLRERLLEG